MQEFDGAVEDIDNGLETDNSSAALLNIDGAEKKHQSELLIEHKTETKPNLVPMGAVIKWKESAVCLLKLALIMGYFILTGRAHFFHEGSKHFSLVSYVTPLGLALLAAVWYKKPLTIPDPDQLMLVRDITDEWKRWMQLVLLVYHYTGASQQLPIYTHVRVLVASYLFLPGYGHFTSFWNKGNSGGFVKYCQKLFRLKFLTVLLCLFMRQPYMNYYFTAVVSFWFTMIWVVIALPPWIDGSSPNRTWRKFGCGAFKITVLTVMVAGLSYSEGVFQKIFGAWPLSKLFQLPAEVVVKEWRFRWMLDRFSVVYGMVFALLYQAWSQTRVTKARGSVWPESKTGAALLCLASMFCLSSYVVLLHHCDNKVACNSWHPYVTWIPNVLIHVLILVPGLPLVNAVVTALVFICVADEVNLITSTVQRKLLPDNTRQLAEGGAMLTITGVLVAHGNAVLSA